MSDLITSTVPYCTDTAFYPDEDVFSRKAIAEKLTNYLSRLSQGAVLAIDAQWGEGKTWFGMNLRKLLSDGGFKTVWIDAFQQDFVEDPFIILSSEIRILFKKDADLKKTSIEVMKALLPSVAKIGGNFLLKQLTGMEEIPEDIRKALGALGEKSVDSISDHLKARLETYEKELASFKSFHQALVKVASSCQDGKPLVIFIDELDRCRPDFAVRLLERVKHFFEVPKITFVLLVNKSQLEGAIAGQYGEKVQADKYLGKFVNMWLRLPRVDIEDNQRDFTVSRFVRYCNTRYYEGQMQSDYLTFLAEYCSFFTVSLRGIREALLLSSLYDDLTILPILQAYVVVLKVCDDVNFQKIRSGSLEGYSSVSQKYPRSEEHNRYRPTGIPSIDWAIQWHAWAHSKFRSQAGKTVNPAFELPSNSLSGVNVRYRDPSTLFGTFADMIDLAITMSTV